jgi:hypothetical protein
LSHLYHNATLSELSALFPPLSQESVKDAAAERRERRRQVNAGLMGDNDSAVRMWGVGSRLISPAAAVGWKDGGASAALCNRVGSDDSGSDIDGGGDVGEHSIPSWLLDAQDVASSQNVQRSKRRRSKRARRSANGKTKTRASGTISEETN